MPAPLVTLTTDFGEKDSYVAEMKGVLLSRGPAGLRIVDLTHEIAPQDVREAALFLRAAVPRFPEGTIHLVVVDPGVGSARRPIIARIHGQTLVGPDNGVFGHLFDRHREKVWAIDPGKVSGERPSRTFHGRDVFAPAAARLARGEKPEELGTALQEYEHLVFPLVEMEGQILHGEVLHIDRFGNVITNVPLETLRGFLGNGALLERVGIEIGGRRLRGVGTHYESVAPGELLAVISSGDLLEVAVREGSAAEALGVHRGDRVRVIRPEG